MPCGPSLIQGTRRTLPTEAWLAVGCEATWSVLRKGSCIGYRVTYLLLTYGRPCPAPAPLLPTSISQLISTDPSPAGGCVGYAFGSMQRRVLCCDGSQAESRWTEGEKGCIWTLPPSASPPVFFPSPVWLWPPLLEAIFYFPISIPSHPVRDQGSRGPERMVWGQEAQLRVRQTRAGGILAPSLDEWMWKRTKHLQGSHGLGPALWASPVPPCDTGPGGGHTQSAWSPSGAVSSLRELLVIAAASGSH